MLRAVQRNAGSPAGPLAEVSHGSHTYEAAMRPSYCGVQAGIRLPAWHHPCAYATSRMRHVAFVLLAVGSLAAVPRRAPAQQAARDLAAFTVVSAARRQYRAVAATLLTMPSSQQQTPRGVGPLAARVSWSTMGVAALPGRRAWTTSDTALAGAFTVLLLVDAAQTRDLARRGWPGFREANPLLGPRPSVGQANTHTAPAAPGTRGAGLRGRARGSREPTPRVRASRAAVQYTPDTRRGSAGMRAAPSAV